jgi:hypothetical protein
MNYSTFKTHLHTLTELHFIQPSGDFVPRHFHITEAGLVTKHFVDCGGTERIEKKIVLQLWVYTDFDHRLAPQKLESILEIAAPLFGDADLEIEVEFQTDTVGRYAIGFNGRQFTLMPTATDCLAKEACGLTGVKPKRSLADLSASTSSCCTPGGACC